MKIAGISLTQLSTVSSSSPPPLLPVNSALACLLPSAAHRGHGHGAGDCGHRGRQVRPPPPLPLSSLPFAEF